MPAYVDDSPRIDVSVARSAELAAMSLRPGSDPTGGNPQHADLDPSGAGLAAVGSVVAAAVVA
jgi:hypothetical protein